MSQNLQMKPLRVCIVPEYPASLMTGGLQVQAEETSRALAKQGDGLSVELFNWSQRAPFPDIYHFIGFPPHLHRIAELIHQAGRPYVITLLLGNAQGRTRLWLARARHFAKVHILGQPQSGQAVQRAFAVVTITEADANTARRIYRIEEDRIHIVPNGVTEGFFGSTAALWQERFGAQPFVLCVGAIQKRKNQLLLLEACNKLRLPAVLLGSVLPGEKNYAQRVTAAAKLNEALGGRWLQSLLSDDPLLYSAYAACGLFCLFSVSETQPLSVLQAMAAQKPILLLRASYTLDTPFSKLATIASTSLEALCPALEQAWKDGAPSSLSRDYSWDLVAKRLKTIYQTISRECPREVDFKI